MAQAPAHEAVIINSTKDASTSPVFTAFESDLANTYPICSGKRPLSERGRVITRVLIFVFCLSFIVIGRSSIPENDVPELQDRLMDLFNGVNAYIQVHETLQNALLLICSLFMDIMFLSTGIYWAIKGKSSRLIVATLTFYGVRTAVQHMFYAPIPAGYTWNDPGFPSLTVPYGRTTDFFFSGHLGIITISGSEWYKYKKYWVTALIALGGLYTCFIMLAYQGHYSIDLFTGIVVGSWLFLIVDKYHEKIDNFFYSIVRFVRRLFNRAPVKNDNDNRQTLMYRNSMI